MILTHLTLLELIEGASEQQIEIMLPSNEFVDISNWFSIDYKPSKKRSKLMKDAALALKRGHGERMRHKLLARLEAAMQAGLTNGFRQRTSTRSIRPRI